MGTFAFRPRERAVIDAFRTPRKVQRWLTELPYNWERSGETCRTFRGVISRGSAHCLEAALSAATVLEVHGYPPLLLSFESQDLLDHVIFVFQREGRWGSIGRSRDMGLHGRKPRFRTVRDLVYSYFDPYIDRTGRILGYGVGDLRQLGNYDWRLSIRNAWKVIAFLNEIPHTRLNGSDARYTRWHRKYLKFRAREPKAHPEYYAGREHWML